jgi:hypothetical protein
MPRNQGDSQVPPHGDSRRWVRRLALDAAWLGWGWRRAPRPLKVIVWAGTSLLVAALMAIGQGLGLALPQPDDVLSHARQHITGGVGGR